LAGLHSYALSGLHSYAQSKERALQIPREGTRELRIVSEPKQRQQHVSTRAMETASPHHASFEVCSILCPSSPGARKGHLCWGKHQVKPTEFLGLFSQRDALKTQRDVLQGCCQRQAPTSNLVNRRTHTERNKEVSKDPYTPGQSLT